MTSGDALGSIDLTTATAVEAAPVNDSEPKNAFGFEIVTTDRRWFFRADDAASRDTWMTLLQKIISKSVEDLYVMQFFLVCLQMVCKC
jgi:hypothetical protein